MAVDDSMSNKCVNVLQGTGAVGGVPAWTVSASLTSSIITVSTLPSTFSGWSVEAPRGQQQPHGNLGGRVHQLNSRRMFDDSPWMDAMTDDAPT